MQHDSFSMPDLVAVRLSAKRSARRTGHTATFADLALVMRTERAIAIDATPHSVYANTQRWQSNAMSDENCRRRRVDAGGCSNRGSQAIPTGRRRGSRNKTTLAAPTFLDGEALGLTRRAIEPALAGDMVAPKLCLERVLPRCHERGRSPAATYCRSLTDGDDVEDEDEDIGDAEAIDVCEP
jgi:hypothetical protein